jgi:hypothetical protein
VAGYHRHQRQQQRQQQERQPEDSRQQVWKHYM